MLLANIDKFVIEELSQSMIEYPTILPFKYSILIYYLDNIKSNPIIHSIYIETSPSCFLYINDLLQYFLTSHLSSSISTKSSFFYIIIALIRILKANLSVFLYSGQGIEYINLIKKNSINFIINR